MLGWIIRALLLAPRRLPPKTRPAYHGKRRRAVRDAKPRPFHPHTARVPAMSRTISGRAYIVDGDTITLQRTQIRLFGIDAPEMNHPIGKKAKSALFQLCKGQTIHAEVREIDAHGRTVAVCRLDDGRDLSEEMVKLGVAIDWPKYSGGVYRHLETEDARKRLWLADARQKGRKYLWYRYELDQKAEPILEPEHYRAQRAHPKAEPAKAKCPDCGAAMVVRPNRRTGNRFFGCSRFPSCKGTRNLE